ncbi:riboflavin synthase alpha chain [Dethiosulfatibacter aminovorans DSM 17477]|uniref:Riboflavin synthase n=1 Tax=Dethiosulfatibacter aminovorans DSM 17477 TaxID=1121476 RepID=A0A1M6BTC1_9FIRM|nr:riboflavin synthase [Dethiosulfatibacter aminovorans]SHI51833.1 riboflavin synthase alpha chain [Dethiosulfatibacter aminovorans DSM 17477]
MFTGLIEEIGTVKKIVSGSSSAEITIKASKIMDDVKLGDSIATNGICLTVTRFTGDEFTVDAMPETMRVTNLKNLKNGSRVNLERALKVGDRLGGHIVSGHVDGTGRIVGFKEDDNAIWVEISAGREILKYIIHKGSITIDGTSLTVAALGKESFKVSIIPLTQEETTLTGKKVGEEVNLECDLVGKYIERLTLFKEEAKEEKKGIDMDFLKENGFY